MSSPLPPPKPKIKIRIRSRSGPQGLDPGAHPRVAETLARSTSAAPPPSVPPPLSELPTPISTSNLLGPQGRDVVAHPRLADALGPPPSATLASPKPRRNPVRAASSRSRDPAMSTPAPHSEEQAKTLERSTRVRAPPMPSGKPIMCQEVIGDPSRKGTDTGKLLVQDMKNDCDCMSTKPDVVMKNHQRKEVVDYASEKGTSTGKVKLLVQLDKKKNDFDWVSTNPRVQVKDEKAVPLIQSIFTKCNKFRSDNIDQATESFIRIIKEKQLSEEVQNATLDFTKALKEIEMKHSSKIIAELAERLSSTAAGLKRVALVSDEDMLLHAPNATAYENPERLARIVSKLKEENICDRCDLFKPDEVATSYLLAVHNRGHVEEIQSIVSKSQRQRDTIAAKHHGDLSKGSTRAALLAAGGSIKACSLVAEGLYKYSFALVRPPGHHAGKSGASGFCLFNNVAVGAAHLLEKYVSCQMRKVLVIDWDVHHGNGTQEIFYEDNRVLFISLHRKGRFYPFTEHGSLDCTGEGIGKGYNVNLPWNHGGIRDVDYITVWKHVVLPIVEEFGPDVIMISAGFDAAEGDSLGKCKVTPGGFATLLDMLITIGPTIMVLEGGYDMDSLSESVSACIKVLLGDKSCILSEMSSLPYHTTWDLITEARQTHKPFWKAFENDIPKEISSRSIKYVDETPKG